MPFTPAQMRQYRKQLREQGICTCCHKKETVDGRSICCECAKRNNAYRDMKRKQGNVCHTCLRPTDSTTHITQCKRCSERSKRTKRDKRKDMAICSECYRKLDEFSMMTGTRTCQYCKEAKNISKFRRYYEKSASKTELR